MGLQRAMGMATAVDDGDVSLERALDYHLSHNHYPPVPSEMIPVCIKAIEVANEDGPWDAEIKLPNGIFYRNGTTAPVGAIIEQHHLQAFIAGDES